MVLYVYSREFDYNIQSLQAKQYIPKFQRCTPGPFVEIACCTIDINIMRFSISPSNSHGLALSIRFFSPVCTEWGADITFNAKVV